MHSEKGERVLSVFWRCFLIAVLAIVVAVACSSAPASAASLGEAGYAQGYMRSLQIISQEAPPEILKYQCGVFVDGNGDVFPRYCGRYVFTPSAHDLDVRWGVPLRWVKGTLVGERGSQLDSCQLARLGLPAGYVQTPTDIADSWRLTLDGVRTLWDDLQPYRCSLDVPPPAPTCQLPKVCMVPPEPCLNCPVCPICPTCPTLPPLSAAEQRAEEIGVLLKPIHQVFAEHSYWKKRLPPWSKLWAASKPLVVEILLAKRRFELRAAGVQ